MPWLNHFDVAFNYDANPFEKVETALKLVTKSTDFLKPFRAWVLKAWPGDWQHRHSLDICYKCRFSGPHPRPIRSASAFQQDPQGANVHTEVREAKVRYQLEKGCHKLNRTYSVSTLITSGRSISVYFCSDVPKPVAHTLQTSNSLSAEESLF